MTHLLEDIDDGTELEITGVQKEGFPDLEAGMTMTVLRSRSKGANPDGSMPRNRRIAAVSHDIPNVVGSKQLKSSDEQDDEVVIPGCMGAARVTMKEVSS